MPAVTTFRNPILSIWQSALQKARLSRPSPSALERADSVSETAQFAAAVRSLQPGGGAPKPEALGAAVGNCAQLAAQYVWAEIRRDQAQSQALEDQIRFGTCDPVWSVALSIYLAWKATARSIPYVQYKALTDFVLPLPDTDLVVGLIGDWGTGLDDADWLLQQVVAMTPKPNVIVHLGDIYYAGTEDEVKGNFLQIVNKRCPTMPVFTLSGNHDMYAGGKPYYWLLSQLNSSATPSLRQPASYFCLRNKAWQLLAMDTGLHDSDPFSVNSNMTYLEPTEIAWHADKLQTASGRKSLLFSHHQLFTSFDTGLGNNDAGQPSAINTKLLNSFQPYLKDVVAWFWGHEHNLEIFGPYLGLAKGRCTGASAIPEMSAQNPYSVNTGLSYAPVGTPPQLAADFKPLAVNSDGTYYHSFAILQLGVSGAGTAAYYQIDSANLAQPQCIFQEAL